MDYARSFAVSHRELKPQYTALRPNKKRTSAQCSYAVPTNAHCRRNVTRYHKNLLSPQARYTLPVFMGRVHGPGTSVPGSRDFCEAPKRVPAFTLWLHEVCSTYWKSWAVISITVCLCVSACICVLTRTIYSWWRHCQLSVQPVGCVLLLSFIYFLLCKSYTQYNDKKRKENIRVHNTVCIRENRFVNGKLRF